MKKIYTIDAVRDDMESVTHYPLFACTTKDKADHYAIRAAQLYKIITLAMRKAAWRRNREAYKQEWRGYITDTSLTYKQFIRDCWRNEMGLEYLDNTFFNVKELKVLS